LVDEEEQEQEQEQEDENEDADEDDADEDDVRFFSFCCFLSLFASACYMICSSGIRRISSGSVPASLMDMCGVLTSVRHALLCAASGSPLIVMTQFIVCAFFLCEVPSLQQRAQVCFCVIPPKPFPRRSGW